MKPYPPKIWTISSTTKSSTSEAKTLLMEHSTAYSSSAPITALLSACPPPSAISTRPPVR